jgi:hypothetical protein
MHSCLGQIEGECDDAGALDKEQREEKVEDASGTENR